MRRMKRERRVAEEEEAHDEDGPWPSRGEAVPRNP